MKEFELIKQEISKHGAILDCGDDGLICGVKFGHTILKIIFSFGMGWEHASVTKKEGCPYWAEMSFVKDLFWEKDECAIQYHPEEKRYVNFHPHCLHIWRPMTEKIPQPPLFMV